MKPIFYRAVLVLSLLSTPVLAVKTGAGPASAQEITDGDVSDFCRVSATPNDPQQDQNRESLRKLLAHIISDTQPFTKISEVGAANFLKPQVYKFPQMIVAGVRGAADVKAFLPEALWPRSGEIEIERFSLSSKDLHVREVGLAMGSVNPQKFLEAIVLMAQQPGAVIQLSPELPRAVHVDIDRVAQASPLFPTLSTGQYRLSLFLKTASVSPEWQAIHQFASGQSAVTGSSVFVSQFSSATSSLAVGVVQGVGVAAQSASSPQQPVVGDAVPASSASASSTAQGGAADASSCASKSAPPAATVAAAANDDDDDFGSDFENVTADDFEEVNIDDDIAGTGVTASTNGAPARDVNAVPAPVAPPVSTASTSTKPAAPSVSAVSVNPVVSVATPGNRGTIPAGMVASGGRPVTISQGNTGAVPPDEFADLRATIDDFRSSQGLTASTMPGQSIGRNPPVTSVTYDSDGWDD